MSALKDRVAIITGANSGIGYATTQRFAHEGATVIAIDRRNERLRDLSEENPHVISAICDVTNHDGLRQVVSQTLADHGCIDILVNNAGFGYYKRHNESTLDEWRYTQSV